VLAAESRLRRRADFARVTRSGLRSGRPELVVHLLPADPGEAAAPPRVGFAASRAVGNSVVRHRVVRVLRAQTRPLLGALPSGSLLVVRALPPAASADSARLGSALRSAVEAVVRKAARQGAAA
jgi:ribonuclease P protein component